MQVLDVGMGMVIAGQQVPGDNGFDDAPCAQPNTYLCEEAANDTRASTGPNNSTSKHIAWNRTVAYIFITTIARDKRKFSQ